MVWFRRTLNYSILLLINVLTKAVISQANDRSFRLDSQVCPCSQISPPHYTGDPGGESEDVILRQDDLPIGRVFMQERTRPWVARIKMKSRNIICGGAVINKRYVLTVGSCICSDHLCDEDGVPIFDVTKEIVVYLKFETDQHSKEKPLEFEVEKAFAHSGRTSRSEVDLGLVRLASDLEFVREKLEPVCLPLADDRSDIPVPGMDMDVYLTNGHPSLDKVDCYTDEFGPSIGKKCKIPFLIGDSEGNKMSFQCSRERNPDSQNEECRQFRKLLRFRYPKRYRDAIKIITNDKNITCHHLESGNHGWCKVEARGARVTENDWGWCSSSCRHADQDLDDGSFNEPKKMFDEIALKMLPEFTCEKMVKEKRLMYDRQNEVCAGIKRSFPKRVLYQKVGKENYKFLSVVTDYKGLRETGKYPYNYYLTSLCPVEAGSPLYQWRNGRPILVGIVNTWRDSKGRQVDNRLCGELNLPIVFTRVTSFLEWISENMKDGNCFN